jgi:rare lipoprotein A
MRRDTLKTLCLVSAILIAITGCSSKPKAPTSATQPTTSGSGYYQDDGPPSAVPADIDRIGDALPRDEPLHRFANRPYTVFGVNYTPLTQRSSLRQRGNASWYGRKFHGQKTAIGETYDMMAMSAAHPTAPLPSYARVTNTRSGQSVIVRVNDRGPFLAGRIVDLSYAAAHRIGIAQAGSGEVDFELLLPPYANIAIVSNRAPNPTAAGMAAAPIVIEAPALIATAPPSSSPMSPSDNNLTQYFVQLGAFGNFANAQAFQGRMTAELERVVNVRQRGDLFRVHIGPFATLAEAQSLRDAAQRRLNTTLTIVTESAR